MKTKTKFYLSIVFMVVFIMTLFLLIFTNRSSAEPILSWTPESITRSIPQGKEKTIFAVFSSNEDLNKVEVWLTPELRPYLTVSLTNFETINKNIDYPLVLNFSIPFDTPIASYKGTLHIRNTETTSKTYSKPLPINLEITTVGSDYVEPMGMPTPEEALAYATNAIEAGDIEEALKMFSADIHNKIRDLLDEIGAEGREEFANSLSKAILAEDGEEVIQTETLKSYSIEMTVDGLPPNTSIFYMIKLRNGNWVIMDL